MNQSLQQKEEQILVRITGQDRPGLTASVIWRTGARYRAGRHP